MQTFIYVLLFLVTTTLACEIQKPVGLGFATSPEERTFFAYRNDRGKNVVPFFRADKCDRVSGAGKYLMIAFGPQNQELSDRVRAFDIARRHRDNGCAIQNSPFRRTDGFNDRKKYLDEKWHAISSCYEISVTETAREILEYPERQPGCAYRRTGKNSLSFRGGFCFFKPAQESAYEVRVTLNDDCLDYAGLERLKVRVTDFQSVLNFYSAKDPTGESVELTSLSSTPIRFTVAPNENLIASSEIYSEQSPRFPMDFYLPDTHAGTPEIERSKPGFIKIRLPLWVDNKCPEACSGGVCQGLCDYAQPLAGQVKIFEKAGPRLIELEANWFQGGIILPRYQGEIAGHAFEMKGEDFAPGKVYRVVLAFNDPKFDFEALKTESVSRLLRLDENLGTIARTGIPPIPPIRQVAPTNEVPALQGIETLNFSSKLGESLEAQLETFSGHFRFSYWPPTFRKVCSAQSCRSIGSDYLTLSLEFRVRAFDEETKKFAIDVLSVKRESGVLDNYIKFFPLMPRVSCRR